MKPKQSSSKTMADKTPTVTIEMTKPKAHIGLLGAVAFGIGTMIGSGIFISATGALRFSGSVGMSLIIWALCGIMTLVTGLVYAELGTIIPQSGGDFNYIKHGLGEFPAFLAIWIIPLFSDTAAMAVMALAFSKYLLAWISGGCLLPIYINKLLSTLMMITICVTNACSVNFSRNIQIVCTSAKMFVLLVISVAGIVFHIDGSSILPTDCFKGTHGDVSSYCLAVYSCMFAYGGFTRIGDIADEIIDPRKTIPKAVIISVSSVTVVYVIANVSFVSVLTREEILSSDAVVFDWSMKKLELAVPLIQIGALLSIYGTCNGDLFGSSRVMFAAARAGHYPEVMSFLNIETSVPVVAICVIQCLSCIWLVFGDILSLINFLSFVSTFVSLLSTISLMKIRYEMRNTKTKDEIKSFHTHIALPVLNVVICCFMLITPFTINPRIEFLYGLGVVASGIVMYILFIRLKLTIPGTHHFTVFCQLIFCISPTEKADRHLA